MRDVIEALFGVVKDNAADVLDRIIPNKQERDAAKVELSRVLADAEAQTAEMLEEEMRAKQRIIMQELTQGDNFTKRMRPLIGYSGIILIFVVHVLVPILEALFGVTITVTIPSEFWVAWAGVTGLYVIGRSFEKGTGSSLLGKMLDKIT